MSTTTSTNFPPPLFGSSAFCEANVPSPVDSSAASPASTPPKRHMIDSDCGSSSGLGMTMKHDGSSEASSPVASDRDSGGVPPTLLGHEPDFALSPPASAVPTIPIAAQFAVPHLQQRWQPHPPLLQPIMATMQSRPAPPALLHDDRRPAGQRVRGRPLGREQHERRERQQSPAAGGLQAPTSLSGGQVLTGIPPASATILNSATAQNNDLFVHVEQGETISLAVGNEVQHIAGPATIRMVGHSGIPASALPLHVPRGHSISQIVDEKGILRHLILSPQNAVNIPLSNAANLNPQMNLQQSRSPHKPPTTPNAAQTPPSTAGGRTSPKSASPPSATRFPGGRSERSVLIECASYAQRKRSTPNKRPAGPPTPGESAAFNGTTAPAENEPASQSAIDHEEKERLREALNRIQQPVITRVACQEADVHWQELDTSEASAPSGPFPQIDPSEFLYEIFLYDTMADRLITQKECPPLSKFNGVRLTRLRPRTDYHVAIRASLPGRQLVGQQSPAAVFRTFALPEQPQMLRVTSRGHSFLSFSWNPPMNHQEAAVLGYVLEMAKGKSEYTTVYDGPAEQARITRLEPSTHYRVHVAAKNETARSDFTPPLHVNTTGTLPPANLPTTSANTPINYQPMYAMGAGVQPHPITHSYAGGTGVKLPAPTTVSISARSVRLSWVDTPRHFSNVVLEMADPSNRGGPHNFSPVPLESYAAHQNAATQSGLPLPDLSGCLGQDTIRSEHTIVKTHKDRYENTTYYQAYQGNADKDRMVPPILQRVYEDESVVELSWKYPSYEYDNTIYVLEGSTASGGYVDGSSEAGAEQPWKLCYKGPNNSATVHDPQLSLFRVQAIKRNVPSAWSDLCYNYAPARSQFHAANFQQPPPVHPAARQQSPPPSSPPKAAETPASTISEPAPSAPNCTTPKFSNITQCSMEISWAVADGTAEVDAKHSLLFEVQRVDKQALIIHASGETKCQLENLRPVEHVQVRIRAVIIDKDGQRTEGDWSPIASAITHSAVTSAPQNLRMKADGHPLTLVWDPPAQLNGSDVIEYLLNWADCPLDEEETADSLALRLLGDHRARGAGKSETSNRLKHTSPSTAPSPPSGLRLEAVALETLHASWTAALPNGSPVEGYKLTLQHEKTVDQQVTLPADVHAYSFESLKPETTYTLEIQAKNTVGWSKTARTHAQTAPNPPDAPTLSLVQATANSLKLKWTTSESSSSGSLNVPPTDELLYFYLERENENGKFTNGLRESSSNRFRIRASRVRAAPTFAGPWSAVFTFETTKQPPPGIRTAPTVSEISSGLFQVEWTPYKTPKEASGVEDSASRSFVYKLQMAPKLARDKGGESWKTVYEGTVNSYTLNPGPSALSSTRQLRVLVVQKSGDEEVQSPPSPVAVFNVQRTPTDSPRKRPGQADQRAPTRVLPPHKMSMYKRFRRFLAWLRRTVSERDGAFIVLTIFVVIAVAIAVFLNNYYQM
ncbi:hypothetical protein M3Y99_00042100 [Aphelenchoides fujianensis]|nr:hypothetical protein M3Y99_00042100 [Aphelenchoides fujianensis]